MKNILLRVFFLAGFVVAIVVMTRSVNSGGIFFVISSVAMAAFGIGGAKHLIWP